MPFDELQAELIDEVGVMAVALFLGMITLDITFLRNFSFQYLLLIGPALDAEHKISDHLPLPNLSANLIPHDHSYAPKTE